MIRKILAPTDLSELSQAGVRYALAAARDLDAEVTIYHVVTADEIRKLGDSLKRHAFRASGFPNFLKSYMHTYEAALAQFVGQNFSDLLSLVKVDEKVELGSPGRNIVERAKTDGVDLIIMATHGRDGLSRLFTGSVTEQVIRNAPCPVLAIPPYLAEAGEDLNSAAPRAEASPRKNEPQELDRMSSGH
jgi:nucleotide-binding universal stress UspA family protein